MVIIIHMVYIGCNWEGGGCEMKEIFLENRQEMQL